FTAGGEVTGATAFIAEYSPDHKRGRTTSWIQFSATLGFFLGLAAPTLLNLALDQEQIAAWAWRLPCLLAGPLGVVGLYIRLRLDESPQFERLERTGQVVRHPLREAIVRGW